MAYRKIKYDIVSQLQIYKKPKDVNLKKNYWTYVTKLCLVYQTP